VSSRRIAGFSLSWVTKVGIAAIVFILFAKWLVGRIPVPGLQRAIQAV
jgi:hypothetical protein